ncbi:MAG: hypothetical protein M1829_003859 [Trizodia sp. TS-e1964]|nr:MAG: hypothetical protein M1829_003859 [Trizodia sp. TS-e1964]
MSVSFVQMAASGEAELWRLLFLYPSISELTRDILDELSDEWNPELAFMLERILQMQVIYLEQSLAAQAHQSPEIVDRSARLSHREVLQIVEKFASNMVQYQSNNNDAALDREAQFRVLAAALSILPLLSVTNLTQDLYRDLRKQLVRRNEEVLKDLCISTGQMSGFSNAGLLIRWSLDSLCDTPSELDRNITIFQCIVSIIFDAGQVYTMNIPEALAGFEVFRELPGRPSSWHKILVQLHRIYLGAIALARHSNFAPQNSERLNQYSCQVAKLLLEFILSRFCDEFERLRCVNQLQQTTMASIGALTAMLGNEPPVNEFHGAFGLLYVAGNLAAEFGHLECFVKSKDTWVNAIHVSMDKGNFRMLRLKLFDVLLRIKQAGFDAHQIIDLAVLDNSDLLIKKEQNNASFVQEAREPSARFAHVRLIESKRLSNSIKFLVYRRESLLVSQMNYGLFSPQPIKPAKLLPVKPKQSWPHHSFLAAGASKFLKPQSDKGQSKPPDRKGKSPDLNSYPPRASLPALIDLLARKDSPNFEIEEQEPSSGQKEYRPKTINPSTNKRTFLEGDHQPIWSAACNGNVARVRYLLEHGANIEANDLVELQLLLAAQNGHEAVVKLLLEKGANLESKDISGRSPLCCAAQNRHEAAVKLLLEKGANLESKDINGKSPLGLALQYGSAAIAMQLLEKGANLESKDISGRSPLCYAAQNGHEAVVKLLLEKGANLESKDISGRSPLFCAAQNGHEAAVKLLLEKGANLESKDINCQSPLGLALQYGRGAIAKLLLEAGASIESKVINGQSPPGWAVGKIKEAMVKPLLKAGGNVDPHYGNIQTPQWWTGDLNVKSEAKVPLGAGVEFELKKAKSNTPLLWPAMSVSENADANIDANIGLISKSGNNLEMFMGHERAVLAVSFYPDDKQLASVSIDGTIKVWDTASGKCLWTIEGQNNFFSTAAFSHDNTQLASSLENGTIKICDTNSGKCLEKFEGHVRGVNSLDFSHNSEQLASASNDGTIKIWDSALGRCIQTLKGHENVVWSVAFSYNSKQLASASEDKTIRIWDTASGECFQNLLGHSSAVWSVAFSHNDKKLASASKDTTIKIWDTTLGICLETIEGHSLCISSVAFSRDDKYLSSALGDATIKIWDTASGKCLKTIHSRRVGVNSVAFSHDDKKLASAFIDGIIEIWDTTLSGNSGGDDSLALKTGAELLTSGKENVQKSNFRMGNPDALRKAVEEFNVDVVKDLLDKDFKNVAIGDYGWLHELAELGYSNQEIANLLVDEKKESPWILIEAKERPQSSINADLHQPFCVHQGGDKVRFSPKLISKDKDIFSAFGPSNSELPGLDLIRREVAASCGLAGVVPLSSGRQDWVGCVAFDASDPSIASVIYELELSPTPSNIQACLLRVLATLKRLVGIILWLQQNKLCCNSFTTLKLSADTKQVEVVRVPFSIISLLVEEVSCLQSNKKMRDTPNSAFKAAQDILDLVFGLERDITVLPDLETLDLESLERTAVYNCALATQSLCLGLISYSNGHTGPIQPFFLTRALKRINLLGIEINLSIKHHYFAELVELTCFGQVIGQAVVTFACSSKPLSPQKYNLLASPEDLIDTWGPGRFVIDLSSAKVEQLCAIEIGGGTIQPTAEDANLFHWERGFGNYKVERPQFGSRSKIIIAATTLNDSCPLDESESWLTLHPLMRNLGTSQDSWQLSEIQAGAQAGQYTVLQFNNTWVRRNGVTLKDRQLNASPGIIFLPFLESLWGLQVSLCTGVARRVLVREMLSDVMESYVINCLPFSAVWEELLYRYRILDRFREPHLELWFQTLPAEMQSSVVQIVRYVLGIMGDTGYSQETNELIIAWPHPEDPSRCFRISSKNDRNLWIRALADSDTCATYAYITPKCLETNEHKCKESSAAQWESQAVVLDTAVCQHRSNRETQIITAGWTLTSGIRYLIGKPGTGLTAKVLEPTIQIEIRLSITRSSIPEGLLRRIQRTPPHRIREKQQSTDDATQVLILTV